MSTVRGWARDIRTKLASSPVLATALQAIGVPKVIGIAWHGVTATELRGLDNYMSKHVSVRDFEDQLKIVLAGLRVISTSELVGLLESGSPLPRRAAFLTFDDGYRGLHDLAFEVLQKHKATATIFLPTSFIGGKRMAEDLIDAAIKYSSKNNFRTQGGVLPLMTEDHRLTACRVLRQYHRRTNERDHDTRLEFILHELGFANPAEVPPLCSQEAPLTWEQICNMQAEGIEFGSHSHFHHAVSSLGHDELVEDLRTSKAIIEANTGRPCEMFAYPFGNPAVDANDNTTRGVQAAGFRAAFLTGNGHVRRNSSLFSLRRNCITAATKAPDLRAILATAGHSVLHRDRY